MANRTTQPSDETPFKDPPPCCFCGTIHAGKCPLVSAFQYRADGTLERVEFFSLAELQGRQQVMYAPWASATGQAQ